jgi:hypothetical protein
MSQQPSINDIVTKRVVYSIDGDGVTIRRDERYRDSAAGPLTLDVCYPPDSQNVRRPVLLFVTGYSDVGAQKILGCKLKELGSYISWAQLAAASGLAAITYTNVDPASDVDHVIQHVQSNAAALGIDGQRIGLWSCSGNVPTALAVLKHYTDVFKCAVFYYPYTIDLDGATDVARAATQFGFITPLAGQTVDELPTLCPLFFARAGHDQMPGLNDALDRLVSKMLTWNTPVTLVNHASGPHAFDLFDDSDISREIIRQTLAFLRFHLRT